MMGLDICCWVILNDTSVKMSRDNYECCIWKDINCIL